MKKFGFTLAEVLITLGIIGVVASLTAPSLVMSSRNEANAAKLAVVVANLENAFNNAIVQEGVDNLFQTRMWTNVNSGQGVDGDNNITDRQQFVGELGRYLNVNGTVMTNNLPTQAYYNNKMIHPMSTGGGVADNIGDVDFVGQGHTVPIIMKNGAAIFIRTFEQPQGNNVLTEAQINQRISLGTNYMYNAADVFIDVNGPSAPNTYGRDIFSFQVSEKGVLYPVGGLDVSIVDWNNRTDVTWDQPGNRFTCINGNYGNDQNNRGIGCTARIIAEGYKMNY